MIKIGDRVETTYENITNKVGTVIAFHKTAASIQNEETNSVSSHKIDKLKRIDTEEDLLKARLNDLEEWLKSDGDIPVDRIAAYDMFNDLREDLMYYINKCEELEAELNDHANTFY